MLAVITACNKNNEPLEPLVEQFSQVIEESFTVGDSAALTVENFVGAVVVKSGQTSVMQVKATKWAYSVPNLAKISVEMSKTEQGLYIKTDNPSDLEDVWAVLEITVPTSSRMDITVGVGTIDYLGRPLGTSFFSSGVGNIILRLPADIGHRLELAAGVGSISLQFAVTGEVSLNDVSGYIGSGSEGEIFATVGVGDIYLYRL